MSALRAKFSGWVPTRNDVVAVAGAVVLTLLGVIGFRTTYGGLGYLVAGVAGAGTGSALGFVLARERLPLIVSTAVAVGGFFVIGAFVVRPDTVGGVLPTPGSFVSLLRVAVTGWAKLLTAVPPVGNRDALLVIPFLCAYLGALASAWLGVRFRALHLCVLPPTAVLALSLLFGVNEPASLLLQGAVFGAAAIGWMSYREGRKRNLHIETGRMQRVRAGAMFLALSILGAVFIGPRLPPNTRERFVLREQTQPPFDPSQYPSPLVGLRRYLDDTRLHFLDTPLLRVGGLPPAGAERHRIRLAVMDDYDGVVWAAAGPGSAIGGTYERVGDEIAPAPGALRASGPPVALTFEILALPAAGSARPSIWMPIAGTVSSVRFSGPRRAELTQSYRINRIAGAAAVPARLQAGDAYQLTTLLPEGIEPESMTGRKTRTLGAPAPLDLPPTVKEIAELRSEGVTEPYLMAKKLEAWLQNGFYSDGGDQSGIAPGHSLGRLTTFIDQEQPIGDAEQYAAAMAVLTRTLGFPSRVVMGFAVPPEQSGEVVELRGRDIDAWVEIAFDGVGWVAFYPTPDRSRTPTPQAQTKAQPRREEAAAESPPPPPTTIRPPDPQLEEEEKPPKKAARDTGPAARFVRVVLLVAAVVGGPIAVVAALAGIVVALKGRRRRRRRTQGGAAEQVAGAWSELVDRARDLGRPVPMRATRMEVAPFLDVVGSADIARTSDAAIFGPTEPTEADAAEVWRQVDAALSDAMEPLRTPHRLMAAVSLTSLRSGP